MLCLAGTPDREGQTRMVTERLTVVNRVLTASEHFDGDEELGGERHFAAVYPDWPVIGSRGTCHQEHKDAARMDTEVGDVTGAVSVCIPVDWRGPQGRTVRRPIAAPSVSVGVANLP